MAESVLAEMWKKVKVKGWKEPELLPNGWMGSRDSSFSKGRKSENDSLQYGRKPGWESQIFYTKQCKRKPVLSVDVNGRWRISFTEIMNLERDEMGLIMQTRMEVECASPGQYIQPWDRHTVRAKRALDGTGRNYILEQAMKWVDDRCAKLEKGNSSTKYSNQLNNQDLR